VSVCVSVCLSVCFVCVYIGEMKAAALDMCTLKTYFMFPSKLTSRALKSYFK